MKNIFIIIAFFTLFLSSCKENERLVYEDKAGLYFNIADNADSVMYSFTMVKYDTDTMRLSVKLLGKTASYDRKFKIVLNEGTTAIEGVHFKKLENEYVLEKNRTSSYVPVYVIKTEDLNDDIKVIDLSIVEDDTFTIGYKNKNRIRYFITNQIVKPSYWDSPMALYFGEYSKVKHQICIDLMGHDFPLLKPTNVQYYMKMGRKAAMYFSLNVVYDENGRLIETWDPF